MLPLFLQDFLSCVIFLALPRTGYTHFPLWCLYYDVVCMLSLHLAPHSHGKLSRPANSERDNKVLITWMLARYLSRYWGHFFHCPPNIVTLVSMSLNIICLMSITTPTSLNMQPSNILGKYSDFISLNWFNVSVPVPPAPVRPLLKAYWTKRCMLERWEESYLLDRLAKHRALVPNSRYIYFRNLDLSLLTCILILSLIAQRFIQ